MKNQELIQQTRNIMNKAYCSGISFREENVSVMDNKIKAHLDFLVPKRVIENNVEHTFFIELKNVALITYDENGKLIEYTAPQEFIFESVQKYRELMTQREKFFIKFFAGELIKIPLIYTALSPLRRVLRKFLEDDFRKDNLKKNFDEKEIKYIVFLNSFGYLKLENGKYTPNNEYIKRLPKNIGGTKKEQEIQKILTNIFGERFLYLIKEVGNTTIVPFIGIINTYSNLLIELQKNIRLPIDNLFSMFKEQYGTTLNESHFEELIINLSNSEIIIYNSEDNHIGMSTDNFNHLIEKFNLEFTQKQLV